MNQKDIKIIKLYEKGLSKGHIARRIGYGGNIADGLERINQTLSKTSYAKSNGKTKISTEDEN